MQEKWRHSFCTSYPIHRSCSVKPSTSMNIKSIIPAKPKNFISKFASWSCFGLRSQPLIMETTSQKFVQIHLIAFNNKHKLAASCHCMYKIVFHQGTCCCCSVLPPAICHICAAILCCCCLQKFRYITEWKHFRYLLGRASWTNISYASLRFVPQIWSNSSTYTKFLRPPPGRILPKDAPLAFARFARSNARSAKN